MRIVQLNALKASCAAVGLAAALLPASVRAQPPAPAAAETPAPQAGEQEGVEEIVVRGRRMSEIEDDPRSEAGQFSQHNAATPVGTGYERWYRRVCVSVSNLEKNTAQYLVDRISRLALQVGLEPGEPGCQPDVIVVFTTNGPETAAYLVEHDATAFRAMGDGDMQLGLDALKRFKESDKPVRWWHVSLPVDARTGNPAMRTPGTPMNGAPAVRVAGPSRLHSGVRDELQHVIIIVDGPKLQGRGTTWQQIGDYLAVVSLAQVDLDANPAAYDTILNQVRNPAADSGLTDWDVSYVRSLYSYDQERRPSLQRSEIVEKMVKREIFGDE